MSHRNAPLSVEGRRGLIERCCRRPIAHVAAEMGISRACASTWVNRYRRYGATGLHERSSVPHHSPQAASGEAVSGEAVARTETWRREHTWSAARITAELAARGIVLDRRTLPRHLARLGLGRRRFIDPSGASNRAPGRIVARWPGHMVHLDVKKVGRTPTSGGWRVHGRDSEAARTAQRAKNTGAAGGYVYLHSAVDGFSRLAYTEAVPEEKGTTAAAFLARAKVFFAAHGITHIHRVITDNGACYRSAVFSHIVGRNTKHRRTKPFKPQHNGKAERYQRIMADEVLYARAYGSEDERSAALATWNIHYNYHRPHNAAGGLPPASRLHAGVTNLQPSYT